MENKYDTPAQMQEPIHFRQIITKDTEDNWVVSLITWIRPGHLPGIDIGDLAHARNRTAQRGAV